MSRSSFYDRLVYMSQQSSSSWTVDPLSSVVKDAIRKLPSTNPLRVRGSEAGRPALVSFLNYGTPDLWWVVMEYNGLLHHLELVAGLEIRLPSKAGIDAVLRAATIESVAATNRTDPNASTQGAAATRRSRTITV